MAKTNEQFDRFFSEKLGNHQEKPSTLAWERLEGQLPKQSRSPYGAWWAVAASLTVLLAVGYLFWSDSGDFSQEILMTEDQHELPVNENNTLSDEPVPHEELTEEPDTTPATSIPDQEPETTGEPGPKPKSSEGSKPVTKPTVPSATYEAPKNLVAEAENKPVESAESAVAPLEVVELPAINLPVAEPSLERVLAQAESAHEEPLYRVSIYSNGIKKGEPVEKNLITELGKTVGQVENLIGKVDEGFAEIQDKKENLFAYLTSKKERTE